MRCFFSIEPPESIKNELIKSQKEVKCNSTPVKKEQLHLTLLFLGEVDEKKVEILSEKLSGFKFPCFEILIKNAGAFPSEKNPRVFWIGAESEEIENLHSQLKKIVQSIGIKTEEIDFHPHLTLGRIKEKCDLKDWIKQNKKSFGSFKTSKILLNRSVFEKNAVVHETLKEIKLS